MQKLDEKIVKFCERNDIFFNVDWDLLIVKFAKRYSDGTYKKTEARLIDCNAHPDGIRLCLLEALI